MRELEPDINWQKIRKYDTQTRWALYRLLLQNQKLSQEEVYSLLSREKDSKCLLQIMREFIEHYELSEEELDSAAGGACNQTTGFEFTISFISVGLGCAASAIYSAEQGHVGQKSEKEGRICTYK